MNDVCAEHRTCDTCQVPMTTMCRRPVEIFEVIVGRVVVQRRWDETISCPRCDAIVCAKAPPSLLDGGILGPTLVTEALCDKVLDGVPVERQARNFQRQGIPIAASTLGRSITAALELLVSLAKRVLLRVKQSDHVQFDSTGLRVLDPRTPTGIVRDTLWVLIGDRRWIYFAPLLEGDGDAIEAVLEGAEADDFQCDGTSVTNFIEKKWHRCRPGCHAHARRRLVAAARSGDPRAAEGLILFARLFAVEKQATKEGLSPTERQQRRQERSVPILDAIREWVLKMAPTVEPKSTLGEGLTYLQRQWMRLNVFVLDGEIEITNNRSERELRPLVMGQHVWFFVGDQSHAVQWTAAFSLVQTALAHGVNPRAYLHAVIGRLIAGHSHTKLDELLPDAMVRTHPELADPLRATHSPPGSVEPQDAASAP
jgi:transposase